MQNRSNGRDHRTSAETDARTEAVNPNDDTEQSQPTEEWAESDTDRDAAGSKSSTDLAGDPTETELSEPSADPMDPSEEAEARYKELSDQYVRLVADFDNFRRRTRANEAAVREQAAANLIKDLLPVIDNLQLALTKAETTSDDAFSAGVTLIEQQLMTVLHNHGVQPIEAVGAPFDPNYMEAVAQIDGQGRVEPGHVVEELRRGYMLHDKVLRPAQVVVARLE